MEIFELRTISKRPISHRKIENTYQKTWVYSNLLEWTLSLVFFKPITTFTREDLFLVNLYLSTYESDYLTLSPFLS